MTEDKSRVDRDGKIESDSNTGGLDVAFGLPVLGPPKEPVPLTGTDPKIAEPEKPKTRFERQIIWATWAGVVVTALTGAIIFCQFLIMSRQNAILVKGASDAADQARVEEAKSDRQLKYAQAQVKSAQDQVDILAKTDRPWLGIGTPVFRPAFEGLKDEDIDVPVLNSGKSPAKLIDYGVDYAIQKSLPAELKHESIYRSPIVLTPGAPDFSLTRHIKAIPMNEWINLYHSEGDKPDAPKLATFFVYGYVNYIDLRTQAPYFTRFCFSYVTRRNNWTSCPRYNDAD